MTAFFMPDPNLLVLLITHPKDYNSHKQTNKSDGCYGIYTTIIILLL